MSDKPRDNGTRIPLSFDRALEGLLAVNPKHLPKTARLGAKKKAANKKA